VDTRNAPQPQSRQSRRDRSRVSPYLMWFAVLGGVAAWGVHVFLAWSVMELSCISPSGTQVDQRGGTPGTGALLTTYLGTGLPLLVAVAALVSSLVLRRRAARLAEHDDADVLALDRTKMLLVLAIFLDAMSIAGMLGSTFALIMLEPCG
jgi:hypothetical protein